MHVCHSCSVNDLNAPLSWLFDKAIQIFIHRWGTTLQRTSRQSEKSSRYNERFCWKILGPGFHVDATWQTSFFPSSEKKPQDKNTLVRDTTGQPKKVLCPCIHGSEPSPIHSGVSTVRHVPQILIGLASGEFEGQWKRANPRPVFLHW